jgi:cell division protein FtsB
MFLLNLIKNKYFLTIIALIVWLLFFDKNDIFTQRETVAKLNKLKTNQQYYREEIKKDSIALIELKTNKESLEKFAREKYLMKKDNEDVFVFVTK